MDNLIRYFLQISLDWPTEYLVRIDGTHGFQSQGLEDIIRSLTFVTNENTYGPYGTVSEEDTSFTIPIKSGEVVGFHDRCGDAVNAIVIHVAATRKLVSVDGGTRCKNHENQSEKLFGHDFGSSKAAGGCRVAISHP